MVTREQAKEIIKYVVEITKPRWSKFAEKYEDLDEIIIRRGYEQGGFKCWLFMDILEKKGIKSVNSLGAILKNCSYPKKYNSNVARGLNSEFYIDLKGGKYGNNGILFAEAVKEFLDHKYACGNKFWKILWQMLICCKNLKEKYNSSLEFLLKKLYSEFSGKTPLSNVDLKSIELEEWDDFLKKKKPWTELYGIGRNTFDFIIGDVVDFKFAPESYKLDSANEYFFKVTGIGKLIKGDRSEVIKFLKSLNLGYSLREINRGIYVYCSKTEKKFSNFYYCRDLEKCNYCKINSICEKNI